MLKKEKQKEILSMIAMFSQKTQVLSALVPLNRNSMRGRTWEELEKAYQAYQKIEDLTGQLHDLR